MRAFGVDTPNENDSFFSIGQPDAGKYQRPFLAGVALPHCRKISIDTGVDNAVEIAWRQWFLFVKRSRSFLSSQMDLQHVISAQQQEKKSNVESATHSEHSSR